MINSVAHKAQDATGQGAHIQMPTLGEQAETLLAPVKQEVKTIDREAIVLALNELYNSSPEITIEVICARFRVNHGEISGATVANIKNRKMLDKISDNMWSKLHSFLMEGRSTSGWKYFDTMNHQLIEVTCDLAKKEASMKMIIAQTGLGKTTSLLRWATRNQKSAHYLLMLKAMNERECLRLIADALGVKNLEATKYQLIRSIANRCNNSPGKTLILDDAGKVITKFYGSLQQLYDLTEGNLAIVLAGVPALRETIRKNAGAQKESWPELMRRISYTQDLVEPSKDIIRTICETYGIKETRVINFIEKKVSNYGDLKNIITAALATNRPITFELVSQLQINSIHNSIN